MLTRRDLNAIAERLTGHDPAAEAETLRTRLGEAHLVLDALAREPDGQPCGPLVLAARALLRRQGHPSWVRQEEPRA